MTLLAPDPALVLAVTTVPAMALVSGAGLRAWRQWLEVRRLELETGTRAASPGKSDLASLRDRVRRLEAIASGS